MIFAQCLKFKESGIESSSSWLQSPGLELSTSQGLGTVLALLYFGTRGPSLLETIITCALLPLWLSLEPRQSEGPDSHGETQVGHDHLPLVQGIWVGSVPTRSQVLEKSKFICINKNLSAVLVTRMIIIVVVKIIANKTIRKLNIFF